MSSKNGTDMIEFIPEVAQGKVKEMSQGNLNFIRERGNTITYYDKGKIEHLEFIYNFPNIYVT